MSPLITGAAMLTVDTGERVDFHPPFALENGVKIREVPVNDRMRLVEDIWDSIAEEQEALVVSNEQRRELYKRLEAYRLSGDPGAPALEVLERIRAEL